VKILCDIDNVIAKFTPAFLEAYNRWQGTRWQPEQIKDYSFNCLFGLAESGCLQPSILEFQAFFAGWELGGGYRHLEPIKDAVLGLGYICQHIGRLAYITRRPEKFHADTAEWFIGLGIPFCPVNHCENKLDHLEHVDVLIEDDPEVTIGAARMGIAVILMDQPYNRHVSDIHNSGLPIYRAADWQGIMLFLKLLKGRMQ
jgi:hypothetical protein